MLQIQFRPLGGDLLGILIISSLEGTDKWIQGFYGPGYTLISYIIGFKMKHWGLLYLGTIFSSLIISLYIIEYYYGDKLENSSKYILAFGVPLFHLFLFFIVWINYSDGIFIFPLLVGVSLFLATPQKERLTMVQVIGLLVMGSVSLLRMHGIIFSTLMVFLFFSTYKLGIKELLRALLILFAPTLLYFGLFIVFDIPLQNWQKLNLYKFFYGVDFYHTDALLEHTQYINFSLYDLIVHNSEFFWQRILHELNITPPQVYPLFVIPLVAFILTKKSFFLIAFIISMLYYLLILPGWERGVYPLYILCFVVFIQLFILRPFLRMPIAVLLIILGFYTRQISLLYPETTQLKASASYIQNELEPSMVKAGILDTSSIFTDDFLVHYYQFNMLKIHSFNGWTTLHPVKLNEKPHKMFMEHTFKQYGIKYIIAVKGGYIEQKYNNFKYKNKISLKYHNIYIL